MNKPKPRVRTTDAEIDAAIALAKLREPFRPKAVAAEFRRKTDTIAVTLATGVELVIPRKLLQGLENAAPSEIAQVEILGPGDSLHWESLDVDHYLPALIDGVFGTRRWMSAIGKLGGSARSAAKHASSRANGAKGGRPRRAKTIE
jgi:hypothetical protein